MALTNGCYSIRPYSEINKVAEVAGQSLSEDANIRLWSQNSGDVVGNHQKFWVSTSSGKTTFTCINSGKVWDVYHAEAKDGQNIMQHTSNGGVNQQFVLIEDTTRSRTLNGQTYAVYKIRTAFNNGINNFCAEIARNETTDGSNIRIYRDNDELGWSPDAQRWIFVKEAAFHGGAVPTDIGISTSSGGDVLKQINLAAGSTSFTFYPTWLCSATKFQLRYRIRSYNGSTYSAWSNRKSPTGSINDEGWGNVWLPNQEPTQTELRKWGSAITVGGLDFTNNIRYELELCVRRFDSATAFPSLNAATGSSSVQIISIDKQPSITCSGVTLNNNGLHISLTGSPVTPTTRWKIDSVLVGTNLVCEDIAFTARSGSYTIGWDKLRYIPADGARIKFNASFDNGYSSCSKSFEADVSYSGGTLSITATITNASNYDAVVNVTSSYTDIVYLMRYKHQGVYETCLVDAIFYPPFTNYDLYVIAENGSQWGIKKLSSRMDSKSIVWNFGSDILTVNHFESIDAVANSLSREETDNHYKGNPYHSRYFEVGGDSDCSVSNAVIFENDIDIAERLKTADYAIFRTPDGFYGEVAISGVSTPRIANGVYSLSVTQKENS